MLRRKAHLLGRETPPATRGASRANRPTTASPRCAGSTKGPPPRTPVALSLKGSPAGRTSTGNCAPRSRPLSTKPSPSTGCPASITNTSNRPGRGSRPFACTPARKSLLPPPPYRRTTFAELDGHDGSKTAGEPRSWKPSSRIHPFTGVERFPGHGWPAVSPPHSGRERRCTPRPR